MTETKVKTELANLSPAESTEQENWKRGNAGKGKYIAAYQFPKGQPGYISRPSKKLPHRFKPGDEWTGNRAGHPKGWMNKTAKLKHEMLDVMGKNRAARMKVLTAALEKDGLRYLNILASLLPKEQVVDLSVRGGLSVLAAQMTDEELLRLAMATGTDTTETEQTGTIDNGETCGSETERSPGETRD